MPLNAVAHKHIERTLKHEGGWVSHPRDPGGETNLGITWPTLRRAINLGLVPANTTIRTLTHDQAVVIYYEFYYKQWEFIPSEGLRFQVYDAFVNHSPGAVVGWFQRSLGVTVDGDVGPVTQRAAQANSPEEFVSITLTFMSQRQRYFTSLSTFDTFGEGWMNRMADNMKYAADDF